MAFERSSLNVFGSSIITKWPTPEIIINLKEWKLLSNVCLSMGLESELIEMIGVVTLAGILGNCSARHLFRASRQMTAIESKQCCCMTSDARHFVFQRRSAVR